MRTQGLSMHWLGLLACALLTSCADSEPLTDSTTNWLSVCSKDSQCVGLECVCGVCTVPCEDDEGCAGFDPDATCSGAVRSELTECSQPQSACTLECQTDADCWPEQSCQEGQCIALESTGTPTPATDAGPDTGLPPAPDAETEGIDAGNGGTRGDTSADSAEGIAVEPTDSSCVDYCRMEEMCLVAPSGTFPCYDDCLRWSAQYRGCGFQAWMECIGVQSCPDAVEFFQAHPDGVVAATPCGPEFLEMDCLDFEPREEYALP